MAKAASSQPTPERSRLHCPLLTSLPGLFTLSRTEEKWAWACSQMCPGARLLPGPHRSACCYHVNSGLCPPHWPTPITHSVLSCPAVQWNDLSAGAQDRLPGSEQRKETWEILLWIKAWSPKDTRHHLQCLSLSSRWCIHSLTHASR